MFWNTIIPLKPSKKSLITDKNNKNFAQHNFKTTQSWQLCQNKHPVPESSVQWDQL